MSQSETISTEIESVKRKMAECDRKIAAITTTDADKEEKEAVLLAMVDKLEAELEVTKDYYAKRETEISTQLGTEALELGQSQSTHQNQKQKEGILKDQLGKLKQQVSEMEHKWEDADNRHTKLIAELEERKTSNYMALMEAETKVVHITQDVHFLRSKTNEIDDRIGQAMEFINELNQMYDLDTTDGSRKSDTGKQSQNSSLASKGRDSKASSKRRLKF